MGTPIAASDLTWLLMDRPNNLMHVNGLIVFDEIPDWDAVREAIRERTVSRYELLRQRPVHTGGRWEWEDDTDFSLDRHLRRVLLDDSSPQELRRYLAGEFARPFDRDHPLWELQLVSGPDGEGGAVLYNRYHHGLADGIRLVQLLLGMCDPADGAAPTRAARRGSSHESVTDTARRVAEHAVRDTADAVRHAGEIPRALVATMNPLRLTHRLEAGLTLMRHPVELSDALTNLAPDDNEITNSVREINRMLLAERSGAGPWHGHPSGDKAIDWIDGISLDGLKKVARHHGGTLNDALLAAVSLAFTSYLRDRGVRHIEDVSWMMPVSLEPIDASLPATLGNHFAVVLYSMPLGIDDPAGLIAEVSRRANRLKHSVEPTLAFGLQRVIAETPATVARRLTEFFSGKTIGQLSNVPGPTAALTLAGTPVHSILGWVPTTGDQPLGVCVFTYNGTVGIGIESDTRMIPDPERITALIDEKIRELIDLADG